MAIANTGSLVTNFNVTPYYDDFDESKNFHRMLFRPGFAVQARELTQMQTILQNQIDRFGEHIFKEGSVVSGVEFNYDKKLTFVKLRDADSNGSSITANNFFNLEVTGATSNIKAIVVGSATGSEAETPDLKTLYVKYLDTGALNTSGNNFFTLGEVINSNTGGFSANVASTSDAVGTGTRLSVSEGIIFAKDHFIRVPAQELIVGKYSANANFKVGFDLSETIVSSSDDSTLLDPAQGSYNYTAPGANRLKLTGTLNKYSLTANTGTDFVELIRIENGTIQSKSNKPRYSEIKDYIANRTSDINGDFLVRGMNIRLREHLNQANNKGVFAAGDGGDSNKLVVDVEPGKAFVQGHDIETIVTKHVPIDKSTTFESVEAVNIAANYGNYVTVNQVAGVWDVNTHKQVTLFDTKSNAVSNSAFSLNPPAGKAAGTARVRAIEYSSGTKGAYNAEYKLYLYDIQMTSNTFSNVKSIHVDNTGSSQANGIADIASSSATLSETDFNRTIFKVPANNIRRLRDTNGNIDTNFQFSKRFDVTIATDGTFSVATGAVDETYPYSVGALNTSQKQAGFYVVLNANTSSSTTVDTGSMSGLANSVTGLSSADTKFNVGDEIKFAGYANTFTVSSVTSSTLGTLQQALAPISSAGIVKKFTEGQVIDMSGVGGDAADRSVTVATSTTANFDIQEALTNTVSATVLTELTKVDGQEISKNYNSGRFVQVTVNQSDGTTNTSGPWNLGFSDIHKIVEVRKNTGNTQFTTSSEGTDVTSSFDLDTGQTDNLYKHGGLKLKSSATLTPSAGDVYLVKLNYFSHDTSQGVGYFSVDSYPIDDSNTANTTAITTQEIPLYTSSTDGTVYNLRDSIDIRPRITDTSTDTTVVGSATVNPATGTTIQSPSGGLRYMAPNENLTADLDYYLARRDVVSLSPTGKFRVTSGRPGLNPLYPEEPSGHLPIAKVDITPYPSLSPEVGRQYSRPDLAGSITPIRTEGYTMKEIGDLRDRIDRLEYYTKLSILEQEAKNLNFADASGVDRFKNGIIVDSFTGHNIGNVYNQDYKAAIDRKRGELRPQFRLYNIDLDLNTSNSSNIILGPRDTVITVGGTDTFTVGETVSAGSASGKLVYQVGRKLYLENVSGTFSTSTTATGGSSSSSGTISTVSNTGNGKYATVTYSHNKIIEQPFATTSRNAAGLFWNFLGDITLSPDNDFWVDTTTAADVQINFESNFDNWPGISNSWETEWNNWETVWTGENVINTLEDQRVGTRTQAVGNADRIFGLFADQNVVEITQRQTRTGIRSGLFPQDQSERIGPRVINTNIIPFMRSRVIQVTGRGFKPNTRLYPFFDDTSVTDYVTPTTSAFANTASEGSNIVSDSNGDVYCEFRIPSDDTLRFRVGDKKFRLTDNPTNATGQGLVTTSGEAFFSARGLTQTVQDTVISTRLPVFSQQEVTDDRTVTSTRRDRVGDITERFIGWQWPEGPDPIAQTFRVNDYTFDNSVSGVFLTKIDLYFASKDPNRPVFVEIREVDPSTSYVTDKVIPFSRVTLEASEINTSDNGSSPTPVTFTTPVHLVNDKDYAIVIKPAASNPNVTLFVSKIGDNDLITNQRVSEQPAVGVLFASANDRTWTAIQDEDLKFNLYIADFDTAVTGSVIFKNEDNEFLKITGSNTFTTIGESIHGQTTIVGNSVLSVNANMVLVGNTSSANGLVVSQTSNTIVVQDVSLANKFAANERVNVVINGVKQEPHMRVHSVTTPTGKVAYFDNVNSTGNTFLHLDTVSGSFTNGEQIKGQTNGSTASIDSIDKLEIDVMHMNAGFLTFDDTQLTTTAKLNTTASARDTTFRRVEENENTKFTTPRYILSKTLETNNISGEKSGEFNFTITTNNRRVAPVIDTERVNAILVDNKINNDSTGETNATGGNAEAKYITRTLTLADGQDAEDIVVKLNAYKPSVTDIEVYYKILNADDSDAFNDRSWVEMSQSTLSSVYSDIEDDQDFNEYEFTIPSAQLTGSGGEVQYTNSQSVTFTGFKYFAIKLVLKSSSEGIVPRVKDLIAIALQI